MGVLCCVLFISTMVTVLCIRRCQRCHSGTIQERKTSVDEHTENPSGNDDTQNDYLELESIVTEDRAEGVRLQSQEHGYEHLLGPQDTIVKEIHDGDSGEYMDPQNQPTEHDTMLNNEQDADIRMTDSNLLKLTNTITSAKMLRTIAVDGLGMKRPFIDSCLYNNRTDINEAAYQALNVWRDAYESDKEAYIDMCKALRHVQLDHLISEALQ